MNPITLRAATPSDAEAVADLGRRAFVTKFGHMYVPADLAYFLESYHAPDRVTAEIADPDMRVCVAVRDGKLAGFCKLVMRCTWPEHQRRTAPIELKQLYLDPDLTGGGIGRVLMDWAFDEARSFGADEIQLSVFSGNDGAQRFYARHGYTKIADIQFWVGEQCDAEFLYAALI